MKHVLDTLKNAARRGAALGALATGCFAAPQEGGYDAGRLADGGLIDAGLPDSGSVLADGGPGPNPLCDGTVYGTLPDGGFSFGYHGQCCFNTFCGYTPTLGSGLCACSLSIPGVTPGPFTQDDGGTCTIIATIGCDGRPLTTIDETWAVAPVVARSDWA